MASSPHCIEQSPEGGPEADSPSRSPWIIETLGRDFWIFFVAALFFDFGVGLYFFLFNLFLLGNHFNERQMGLIGAMLTLGNVAGTIPVSMIARRIGLQKLLLYCFIATPIVSISRTMTLLMPAQMGLAFLAGTALSSWPVSFAPTIASLTNEKNRVFAFSISFATGIGTGTLAGLAGGFLPRVFQRSQGFTSALEGMRPVLIVAALIAMIGAWPVSRLKLDTPTKPAQRTGPVLHPYLRRFLPAFAIWSIVTGSFIPFAPVFFQKKLGMPLEHVGEIFSASQLAQFCAVLVAPLLYRKAGAMAGIICAQILSGGMIIALAYSHSTFSAVSFYLAYTAIQFTAGPGFYGTLMSRIPAHDRSSASALQNIVGALAQASSAALTGVLIVRFGYGFILNANAILACLAALLVATLISGDADPRDGSGGPQGRRLCTKRLVV